jgi:hypothetical protein
MSICANSTYTKKKFGIPLFADDRMPMTEIYTSIILMSICANITFAGKKLYIYYSHTYVYIYDVYDIYCTQIWVGTRDRPA